MDDHPADALLRDALLLLNDRPNFGLRRDPGFTSYRLATRIDQYLASRCVPSPPDPAAAPPTVRPDGSPLADDAPPGSGTAP